MGQQPLSCRPHHHHHPKPIAIVIITIIAIIILPSLLGTRSFSFFLSIIITVSIIIVIVHHLGYWEYRNRLLLPITVGCGLLSVGYLVTASPIAPILAHVLSHATSLVHGAELPPHPHRAPTVSPERVNHRGGVR